MDHYDLLDEALLMMADRGPEYGPSEFANHGPMAAEALCALGRADALIKWVEQYRRQLDTPRPRGTRTITSSAWREALGDYRRIGDWSVFFERALQEAPWQAVLARWVPELAPGIIAAAFHGAIRTGHAARALANRETGLRRQELAEGLAYWAARYQKLPEGSLAGGTKTPAQALDGVAMLPAELRRGRGSIVDRMEPIADFKPFETAASAVDTTLAADMFVTDLMATFARAYLANPAEMFVFLHAVTGPGAAQLLLPYLERDGQQKLLRYTWQACAAVYAVFGAPVPLPPSATTPASREQIIEGALKAYDEHAIKFGEVCLRLERSGHGALFMAAAADANRRFAGA